MSVMELVSKQIAYRLFSVYYSHAHRGNISNANNVIGKTWIAPAAGNGRVTDFTIFVVVVV